MPRAYIKKNIKKNYSDNDLKLAIQAVGNGSSIREASNAFNIPYTTLNSHSNSFVLYDNIGRPSKFTKEEEICLEQAALTLQNWGAPLTIGEFLNLARQYASNLNKSHLFPSGTPTSDWLRSFLRRHENLILKRCYPLEKKRANLTIEQINKWFDLLSKIIQENDLANRPGQIFNCDESGMSDNISYSKVLVHRQTSKACRIQVRTGGKSYTSVMFCASATGFLLPPFVIYKSKRLFQEWCVGGPPNICFSNSESGWIDQVLFYQWFEQVFVQQTKDLSRPLLLIVDGYGAHFSVETLRFAVQNNIIIVCLPSNATHILQPLDVMFFNPSKIEWKKILKDEYIRTKFKSINKTRFPQLLNQLFETEAIKNKNNIIKSFMRAGIFPFNPKSIDHSCILQNNESYAKSSSTTTNTTNTGSINNSSVSVDCVSSNNNHHNTDDISSNLNTFSSFNIAASSFASSQEAISALDRVLAESIILNNSDDNSDDDNDDDDDDDEDYVPARSIVTSSKPASSTKKQTSKSKKLLKPKNHQLTSSRKSNKKKKISFDLSSFDSSDQDEDIATNSPSKSLQLKKSSLIKNSQSGPSNQDNQQKQIASITSSFDVSNEGDDMTVNQSSTKSQQALRAISDTLQIVFSSSSKQSPAKAKKRTVLKRSVGQIMTEEDVINQMEEANNKKKYKRSRSGSQQPNATKRRKKQKNDSSVVSPISSTISIEPPSQPIVLGQLSTFTNTSSSAFQQTAFALTHTSLGASQQSNQYQSYVNQAPINRLLSTDHLSTNNSHNSLINSLFNSVPGALQSSIICSQCRITVTVPTVCRTCHRTFCITCINQGKYNSCLFCIMRFSSLY